MTKFLSLSPALLSLLASFACGGAEGVEYDPETGEEVELGELEQPIKVHEVYGVQKSGTAAQMRCVAGAASDCFVPASFVAQVAIKTDGVPLNADRALWETVFEQVRVSLNGLNDDFTVEKQVGPLGSQVQCTFRPQASFTPASTSSTDIRKYVGGYSYIDLHDQGSHTQFYGLSVAGDFVAMKAYKGGTCSNSGSNACYKGMVQMASAFMAACLGSGLTTNTSCNGKNCDLDVHTTVTDQFHAGDMCRRISYENTGSGVVQVLTTPSCAL